VTPIKDGEDSGNSDPVEYSQAALLSVGSSHRSAAIESMLAGGAVVICAQFSDAPGPVGIEGRSCQVQHTLLARLVVYPKSKE
jgi:hypothetical protein